MKTLQIVLFLLVSILIFDSCQGEEKNNKEDSVSAAENELYVKAIAQFSHLYTELLSLKEEEKFHSYGFKMGGPYEQWMIDIEQLSLSSDSILLINSGVMASELKQLGIAYEILNGEESNFTYSYREIFDEVNQTESYQ